MLVFDGVGCHITAKVLNFLEDHEIVPFCLPAHTSHIMQLLDIGGFQAYKPWHAEMVDEANRISRNNRKCSLSNILYQNNSK
jgi:hypothetical protein